MIEWALRLYILNTIRFYTINNSDLKENRLSITNLLRGGMVPALVDGF